MDIFAVFYTEKSIINRISSIKFTFKIEEKGQLPSLDVPVLKNYTNKLEFDTFILTQIFPTTPMIVENTIWTVISTFSTENREIKIIYVHSIVSIRNETYSGW